MATDRRTRKRADRTRESYRSPDQARRAAQLANLRSGGGNRGLTRAHGAYAAIARAELAEREQAIFAAVAADAPVREHGELPAADAIAVAELAKALILRDRVVDFVDRRGFEDADGNVRAVVAELAKHQAMILNYLEALGMTPRSRAKLGVDLIRGMSAADQLSSHLERYQ